MPHLLLVESWVGAMGTLLPRAVTATGAEFTFLTRNPDHYPATTPDGAPHPLRCVPTVIAETNDPAAALAAARRIHAETPIDGVLTACDYYLHTAAVIASELGLPTSSPDAVRTAADKHLARRLMDEAGLPGPEWRYLDDASVTTLEAAAESIGYPLVVKPADLCGGMLVRIVHEREELHAAARAIVERTHNARHQARTAGVLLEALLDGPEFSVETVAATGEITVVGITDKSLGGSSGVVETGHMFPAHLAEPDRAAAATAAVSALKAVGLDHGVCHTEVRLTSDGPRIIEINARPAGNQITELVRYVTGIDLPSVAVGLAVGHPFSLSPTGGVAASAAVSMFVPRTTGVVTAVRGTRDWPTRPEIVQHRLPPVGTRSGDGADNNGYLGWVMTVSREAGGARPCAEELVSSVHVDVEESVHP